MKRRPTPKAWPARLACLLAACGAALLPPLALAHNIPGLSALSPGQAFVVASFRGLVVGADGKYHRQAIDMNAAHDGSALTFLIFDPNNPADIGEAKRFEAALKKLPNTHGFLVLPPGISQLIDQAALTLDRTGLTGPVIVDNQAVFPGAFRHSLRETPRYEILDRSQTLVIQNALSLRQKSPTGETVEQLIKLIDRGETVAPWVIGASTQRIDESRE